MFFFNQKNVNKKAKKKKYRGGGVAWAGRGQNVTMAWAGRRVCVCSVLM